VVRGAALVCPVLSFRNTEQVGLEQGVPKIYYTTGHWVRVFTLVDHPNIKPNIFKEFEFNNSEILVSGYIRMAFKIK
jgi:hypothetical protein